MCEDMQGLGAGATIAHIADMLRELRRLSGRHKFLTYLIEMAEVEAGAVAKHNDNALIMWTSSKSARSQRELIGQ